MTEAAAWPTQRWVFWQAQTVSREHLFGNGERTGNVDIVTLAMNMFSQGVDPELDFSDMPQVSVKHYERLYRNEGTMSDSPYSGASCICCILRFSSGCDRKGNAYWREEKDARHWTVPYLPIDPTDVGRNYDADVIRINSQSGKGGVGYILETELWTEPAAENARSDGICDKRLFPIEQHKELHPDEIFRSVQDLHLRMSCEPYKYQGSSFPAAKMADIATQVTSTFDGKTIAIRGIRKRTSGCSQQCTEESI